MTQTSKSSGIEKRTVEEDMPLMNYSTKIEAHRTVSEITAILVRHGATRIMQEYDGWGNVVALKWSLDGRYGSLSYALPVNYEAVYDVLTEEGLIFKRDDERRKEQARRVAWRILKDWIEAQIALLVSGMVEMEEIFLPYMLSGGGDKTLYAALADRQFSDLHLFSGDAIALPPAGSC